MARIEQWGIVSNVTPYLAPECIKSYVVGLLYDHDTHPDGKDIKTSSIVGKRNGAVVTNSGSVYELGEPDPEYEALYPNAKERLIESLEEK